MWKIRVGISTAQALLQAHEHVFNFFDGVFRTLRHDNLKAAVKKIVRGFRREETARFIALRSPWRFATEFCTIEVASLKSSILEALGRNGEQRSSSAAKRCPAPAQTQRKVGWQPSAPDGADDE